MLTFLTITASLKVWGTAPCSHILRKSSVSLVESCKFPVLNTSAGMELAPGALPDASCWIALFTSSREGGSARRADLALWKTSQSCIFDGGRSVEYTMEVFCPCLKNLQFVWYERAAVRTHEWRCTRGLWSLNGLYGSIETFKIVIVCIPLDLVCLLAKPRDLLWRARRTWVKASFLLEEDVSFR